MAGARLADAMEPCAPAAAPRAFRLPAVLRRLLVLGFFLFALSHLLFLAQVTKDLDGRTGDGDRTAVVAAWLGEVAMLLLAGGLILGGVRPELPGWAQVALVATGALVAVTVASAFPAASALWYGLP